MGMSRRTFLGGSGAGALLGFLGLDLGGAAAYASEKSAALRRSRITTTICPFCAVGCGLLVMAEERNGRRVVVNVEGDPDHPINEGALCPKGAALPQLVHNDGRLSKVLYRAPGGRGFEEKDWEWAVRRIARRIKDTRDATFERENARGQVVNRTRALASVGSAALDNEECWLYQAFLRSLGTVYIEHQARI